ncbi:MAG: hypothetical protein IH608_11075 [Proteobacteria bacterium]|nr:hypothetical protein [Pseudomonadota bacterium]
MAKIWMPLENGEFHVKDSVLFGVRPEFDQLQRLYQVTFSVPLPEKFPAGLAATAYQSLATELWGKNPDVSVTVRTGKGAAETTLVDRKLLQDYTKAVQTELSLMLRR